MGTEKNRRDDRRTALRSLGGLALGGLLGFAGGALIGKGKCRDLDRCARCTDKTDCALVVLPTEQVWVNKDGDERP